MGFNSAFKGLIDTYKTKFCYCGVLFYFMLPFLADIPQRQHQSLRLTVEGRTLLEVSPTYF